MVLGRNGSLGNEVVSLIWKRNIMITSKEAVNIVNGCLSELFSQLKIEETSIDHALGRLLAEDVVADRDQPPFHRVAMDGIAINSSDFLTKKISTFSIVGVQAAGLEQLSLTADGKCLEVMTGAVLPLGCDTVIPYECLKISNQNATINDDYKVMVMNNIHQKGSDYREDSVLLKKGTYIKSPELAVLATVGRTSLKTYKLPSVCIVSTGDELVDISETPQSHQIRRSNSISLQQELKSFFPAMNIVTTHLKDDQTELYNELQKIISEYEVVILSGGVSMGKFDFIPSVLTDLKVQQRFHKISQRPGKPVWFGDVPGQSVIFGLPGNPISCLFSLRKYVVESLLKIFGKASYSLELPISEDVSFQKEMTYFMPFCMNDDGTIRAIKTNGSGDFYSVALSDGIVEFPSNESHFKKGNKYPILFWGK